MPNVGQAVYRLWISVVDLRTAGWLGGGGRRVPDFAVEGAARGLLCTDATLAPG